MGVPGLPPRVAEVRYRAKVGDRVKINVLLAGRVQTGVVESRDGEYVYVEPDDGFGSVELYDCELELVASCL